MVNVNCLNNIASVGLDLFSDDYNTESSFEDAQAVLVRSAKMHDMELGDNLLAIARAAVSRPPVLILDEATSSVDTRTERLIEKGMDAIMQNRTVFVIAHRLSTVRNSNAIMVLEKGEIIERGSHDELISKQGRYYQLYTGQFELE